MSLDDLGIVVIGRNEGGRLIDSLTSLRAQKGKVVYVDSGSKDGSAAVAEQLGASVVELDTAKPFTAARARNEGFAAIAIQNPNIQFVQFIDGDCELVDTWLNVALAFIKRQNEVAVVCGRRRERYPERSVYNRLCDIEWNSPIGETLACGGDSLMRVSAFKEVNGFQAELIAGEEPELCSRIRQKGWKVWRLDAEMTRHDAAMTRFSQWWLRAVRSGYAVAEISMQCPFSLSACGEKKEVVRAALWAGILPLIIVGTGCFHPAALLGIFTYPLQVCRIAIRRGAAQAESWTYGAFMMVVKLAQLQGILRYLIRACGKRPSRLIEYKRA
jgi:glycosyltransferase involved in cell wall biosynthesis